MSIGRTRMRVLAASILGVCALVVAAARFHILHDFTYSAYAADKTTKPERLLARVEDGFIDKSGAHAITLANSEYHGNFSSGLARVWTRVAGQKLKWGYIDATGHFAVAPVYDWALPFSDDVAVVNVGAAVGDHRHVAGADVLWAAVNGGKWMVIDRKGAVLSKLDCDEMGSFRDGLAPIRTGGKWGYVDKTGKTVISARYDGADEFRDGLGAVRVGRMWGFIDKTGKEVIEPAYPSRIELLSGQILLGVSFSNGLAWVGDGKSWGVIDHSGKFVIAPQYANYGRDFSDGLSAVKSEHKTLVIDISGHVVAETSYDDILPFSEGIACFRSGQKYGAIDKSGSVVIEPKFDSTFSFSEGLAVVSVGGFGSKAGYIDEKGAWVIPPADLGEAWGFQRVSAGTTASTRH